MPSWLRQFDRAWTGVKRGTIAVAGILVVIVVVRDLSGNVTTIEPINLPKSLTDAGLNPEIVAIKLQSQLAAYQRRLALMAHAPGVTVAGDPSNISADIVVPGTGLSISGLTAWLGTHVLTPAARMHLGLPLQKRISGEIVELSPANYKLYIRWNGEPFALGIVAFSTRELDDVVQRAAADLAWQIFPYQYAVSLYDTDSGDHTQLMATLSKIIVTKSPTDESVARAHNLMGILSQLQGDPVGAMAEFEQANALAEQAGIGDFGVAYGNMALLELQRGNRAQARIYVMAALAKNPGNGDLHLALSSIDADEGDDTAAQLECDIAESLPRSNQSFAFSFRAYLAAKVHDYGKAIQAQREYIYRRQQQMSGNDALASAYMTLSKYLLAYDDSLTTSLSPAPGVATDADLLDPLSGASRRDLAHIGLAQFAGTVAVSHAAILQEACTTLRTVIQLWNRGDTKGVTPAAVFAQLKTVSDRRSHINPAMQTCLLEKRLPPEAQWPVALAE